MSTCGKLFHADRIYAYHDHTKRQVVVLVDVTLNPVADDVHICPNLIAPPSAREFLVEGTTKPGIHPALAVIRRVSYAFFSDLTPKSVIVYSADDGMPVRHEVPVGSAPPPWLDPSHGHGGHAEARPSHGPVEVTGFSPTFSLEQAVQDALAQAAGAFPAPSRNPDVAVEVEIDIKDISARSGGTIRPGLSIRATAK
jgi:hypothetical protein